MACKIWFFSRARPMFRGFIPRGPTLTWLHSIDGAPRSRSNHRLISIFLPRPWESNTTLTGVCVCVLTALFLITDSNGLIYYYFFPALSFSVCSIPSRGGVTSDRYNREKFLQSCGVEIEDFTAARLVMACQKFQLWPRRPTDWAVNHQSQTRAPRRDRVFVVRRGRSPRPCVLLQSRSCTVTVSVRGK